MTTATALLAPPAPASTPDGLAQVADFPMPGTPTFYRLQHNPDDHTIIDWLGESATLRNERTGETLTIDPAFITRRSGRGD